MAKRGMDFKSKEVINITDARRLGFVQDVCADLETGKITSIVVPGSNKLLSMFTSENDIVITWDKIKCIGEDIILVEIWYMMTDGNYKIIYYFLFSLCVFNANKKWEECGRTNLLFTWKIYEIKKRCSIEHCNNHS